MIRHGGYGTGVSAVRERSTALRCGARRAGRSRPKISILFVDDRDCEAARIESALTACRDFNVDVDHVCDPTEACRRWEERTHDLALFDIWLGNGTSIGLLDRFEQGCATRPIVVLTSLSGAEARSSALSGCDLLVHSKEDLSSAALALTLGSALALSQQAAVMLTA